MKLRALDDNNQCWKKGDVFECLTDSDGMLYITCRLCVDHWLISKGEGYTPNAADCPDFASLEEASDAQDRPH